MEGSKEMFLNLRQIRLNRKALFIAGPLALPLAMFAQTPPMLTLQQAEAMAIMNHPQIQAARNEVNFANQQIVINRSAYYPNITGEVIGSQANDLSRLGVGDLAASRLFDREAQGVIIQQLITDSGRTPSLVAGARFQAQAAAQNSTATRYTVLLDVNRA
jgi:outer membrane protein